MELTNLDFIINSPKLSSSQFSYTTRIGIVGFGKLGQYLVEQLLTEGLKNRLELTFIWNRTALSQEVRSKILIRNPLVKFLVSLEQIKEIDLVDLIVEVCHPSIVHQYAFMFLDKSDFLLGSPTALADQEFAVKLAEKLTISTHRMFVARGALWGANDIQMMARRSRLQSVHITMHFHPKSLRIADEKLRKQNDEIMEQYEKASEIGSKIDSLTIKNNTPELRNHHQTMTGINLSPTGTILYEGPARQLCHIAPNNVNTIATAAILGLGMDQTFGCLVTDPSLCDYHKIDIEVRGKPTIDGNKQFSVYLERKSPTNFSTSVTSTQTFNSFWNSILQCTGTFSKMNSCEFQIC